MIPGMGGAGKAQQVPLGGATGGRVPGRTYASSARYANRARPESVSRTLLQGAALREGMRQGKAEFRHWAWARGEGRVGGFMGPQGGVEQPVCPDVLVPVGWEEDGVQYLGTEPFRNGTDTRKWKLTTGADLVAVYRTRKYYWFLFSSLSLRHPSSLLSAPKAENSFVISGSGWVFHFLSFFPSLPRSIDPGAGILER